MVDYGELIGAAVLITEDRPDRWTSYVRFLGLVDDPLLPGNCPMSWNIGLQVDVADPTAPVARVRGGHKGFPAYEIYIDGEPVYQWKPPASRTVGHLCLTDDYEPVDSGPIRLK